MAAEACCVDAAVSLPPYVFAAWGSPLPENTPATPLPLAVWAPAHSAVLYRLDRWGAPYFNVNPNGNISVRPYGASTLSHQEIDLLKVVEKASGRKNPGGLGLQLPLVVRFPDVLKNRLESLQSSFDLAIQSQGYEAPYRGVYPVKCNQDKYVVEDIVKFGARFRFGLEAGSKPELLLAMSCLCDGRPEALLVCNGFKDVEYISLALLARKIHLNAIIVLEQEEELDIVIEVSKKLSIRPVIGVRAKLRTKHSGHFGSTSGERGKFGLTTTQILHVVEKLQRHEMLDCLQLLHFHIGSQIPTTSLLADGVGEAAQIYCELVRFGASMKVIDVGGGLGIDYDGSMSGDSDVSVGYTLQEYASAVVEAVKSVCDSKGVKHPVICSESGRAIVSHHSILVFQVNSSSSPQMSLGIEYPLKELPDDALEDYHNLCASASRGEYESSLFYAEQLKQRCADQFREGSVPMDQLAAVDCLCEFVSKAIGISDPVETYHVNLSIFTSIPDFWGIHQLFPIMPIHRLDEKPSVRGILSDLTCDSDGKINKFIGGESSLPLHSFKSDSSPYYLGMFLGGAYEEALGGFHNLFGRPSIIRVSQSDGPYGYSVTQAVPGLSCADVLRVMHHQPEVMFQTLKERIEDLGNNNDDDDDDDDDVDHHLVSSLACSFGNMPYLVAQQQSRCRMTACYYRDSDECYLSSSSSHVEDLVGGADEEEQWSYCVA